MQINREIPIVDVSGSTSREVGYRLGQQLKGMLHDMVDDLRNKVNRSTPNGWDTFRRKTKIYRGYVECFLPRDHDEMVGTAAGAQLELDDLYSLTCLELREELKGCTDFVVAGTATVDGTVLACHNEDWSADEARFLVVRRGGADDEPRALAVTYGGIIPSIGFTEHGLALTGNALSPNDKRYGIPKLHIVREILRSSSLADALHTSTLHPRASSFNNVYSTADGQIYNFEGSATSHVWTFSSFYSVHTNHYVSDDMKKYESNPDSVESMIRYNTARTLIERNAGSFTPEICRQVLTSHLNYPSSPCRHGGEGETCTVFSAMIDVSRRVLHLAAGNPCTVENWQSISLVGGSV